MSSTPFENWCILHIDDDEDDHFIVRTMLREAQGRTFSVEWAATYDEGQRKLNSSRYDAVLVDYDLGSGTGIDLIRKFVEQEYPAPMILLTGRGSYDVDVEAMHAGATLYLTKNEINPLLLERSIRYAIERKQAEEKLRLSEEKFAAIFDRSPTPTFLLSVQDDHYVDVNQAYLDLIGFKREEVIGKNSLELGVTRDAQSRQRIHEEVRANGFLRAADISIFTGSGEPRITSASLDLIEIEGEQYILGTIMDITEQKEAEQALLVSERSVQDIADRFKAILENSIDMAYRRNLAADRYDYMSPVVEKMLGFTVDEMMEMSIQEALERIHEEDREKMEAALNEAAVSGRGKLEYRFLCKDGRYRWLADYVSVTSDEQGKLLYRTGIARDVTEQRWAEEALRLSEERFQLASRAVTGVLYDWTMGREHLYQSEGLERVVGYKPGEEPGGSSSWWPENIHPDDLPEVRTQLQAAIDGDAESLSYIYRIRHRDGHWVYVLDQGYIVRDEEGQAQRVVGICTDISDRVRIDQALEESERCHRQLAETLEVERATLAAAIENLPVGVGITDAQGTTLSLNQEGLRLHGFSSEEEMFSRLDRYADEYEMHDFQGQMVPFEDWPAAKALRRDFVKDYQLYLCSKLTGKELPVSYSALPVYNSQGEVILIVYLIVDLTERL
jgi:PAS domain S-box-containing protein